MARHAGGFGPGTMILTDQGDVPVEWLDTSYRVLTRDNGYQSLRRVWRTRVEVCPAQAQDVGESVPVRIPVGALGDGRPMDDLYVTADQHLLFSLHGAARSKGLTEALAPAQAWADLGRAESYGSHQGWTVTNILCAEPEVILAQGAWAQSCLPCGQNASAGAHAATGREISATRRRSVPTGARKTIDCYEARQLIELSRETGTLRWSVAAAKRA